MSIGFNEKSIPIENAKNDEMLLNINLKFTIKKSYVSTAIDCKSF